MNYSFTILSLLAGLSILTACSPAPPKAHPIAEADKEWPFYGSDEGGQRFSAAGQVTPQNVTALQVAWTFSTGDVATRATDIKRAAFEDTPIMAGGRLYIATPFNEVIALDPASGKALWRFDPRIDTRVSYGEGFTARGVAYWRDPAAAPTVPCAERIFLTTNDRRLFALDAATGKTCASFGEAGAVDVAAGVQLARNNEMQITSPPVVARGVVVVGSAIADNQRVKEVSGAVRADRKSVVEGKIVYIGGRRII